MYIESLILSYNNACLNTDITISAEFDSVDDERQFKVAKGYLVDRYVSINEIRYTIDIRGKCYLKNVPVYECGSSYLSFH